MDPATGSRSRLLRTPCDLSQNPRRALRRAALRILLVSLALSALIGVIALLDSDFGDTQEKLLLTSLATLGASVILLSCGLAWERSRLGPVPPIGIACALVGFGIVVYAIWLRPDVDYDNWARAFVTEVMFAVAAAHLSLVAVTGATGRFRWADYLAYGLNLLAVLLLLSAIWNENVDDDFWRVFGIVMVLLLSVTIARPILHRLRPRHDNALPIPPEHRLSAVFCPRCGTRLPTPGQSSCAACGASFQVSMVSDHPPDD
ncbi:MAG: hypothetical protein OXH19_08710 [Chloroflexi bacterium]|nr:hypothetical protein [Chloroflexota bacterium]MCY3587265.1 hypothetical protein [Chloroflexota bacterium]MCY3686240.1 hypothetical protein [Chloroflexota bacterium]MDE2708861.1 hypothetical protein [Chloroflexota bacterium]